MNPAHSCNLKAEWGQGLMEGTGTKKQKAIKVFLPALSHLLSIQMRLPFLFVRQVSLLLIPGGKQIISQLPVLTSAPWLLTLQLLRY